MREFWIQIDPHMPEEKKEELVKKTSELCTAYLTEPDDANLAKRLGAKKVVSRKNGDILLLRSMDEAILKNTDAKKCVMMSMKSDEDEERILKSAEASADYIIAKCEDWKVIPLENLIASTHGKSQLLALVSNAQEASIALEVLEIGVDGVVANLTDIDEIQKVFDACKHVSSRVHERESAEKIAVVAATITQIKPLPSGARTCIDTCDLMREGEGLLVGCQSTGLFLIQAETEENPFVAARPFRVNAGAVAQYLLTQGGETRYLSELRIGDPVMIVDRKGICRMTSVCRTKIEWRPLLFVEAEFNKKRFKTIVQNAETIKFVTKNGAKSVKELAKGDEVLLQVQDGGRHFGKLVTEENVIEQ
jgi:3-dehydroquinate synthase II